MCGMLCAIAKGDASYVVHRMQGCFVYIGSRPIISSIVAK